MTTATLPPLEIHAGQTRVLRLQPPEELAAQTGIKIDHLSVQFRTGEYVVSAAGRWRRTVEGDVERWVPDLDDDEEVMLRVVAPDPVVEEEVEVRLADFFYDDELARDLAAQADADTDVVSIQYLVTDGDEPGHRGLTDSEVAVGALVFIKGDRAVREFSEWAKARGYITDRPWRTDR